MLTIENLTKSWGAVRAVDSVNIQIDRPMMIGIIGASGAGKSTLLRMLNRLET
ncbi:ATP-binding cassette domain-containing protein [bacterium LRH843]|nr:ATP-binding cassette domain-containing protein [bacterium LRH843]